jgi:hypothetical protein
MHIVTSLNEYIKHLKTTKCDIIHKFNKLKYLNTLKTEKFEKHRIYHFSKKDIIC